MLIYEMKDFFNKLNNKQRTIIFNKFIKRVEERFKFEIDLKLNSKSPRVNELVIFLNKRTYYFKIINLLQETLVDKHLTFDEFIKEALNIDSYNYSFKKAFLFKLYLVYEYELFNFFLIENNYLKNIYIKKPKYHLLIALYNKNKKLYYTKITRKNILVADKLGIIISNDLNDEISDYKLNDYGFEVTSLSVASKTKVIDLRQLYICNKFYVYPNLLEEVLKIDGEDNIVILPLFTGANTNVFNSAHHGTYKVLFEYDFFYYTLIRKIIEIALNKNIVFIVSNITETQDYIFWNRYLKKLKKELNLHNIELGLLIDDYAFLSKLIKQSAIKTGRFIVGLDKLIYNLPQSQLTSKNLFPEVLVPILRDIHQDLRKLKISHSIKVFENYSPDNIEKLLKMGYRSFIISHKNVKNWDISASNYIERRGKYKRINKKVAI